MLTDTQDNQRQIVVSLLKVLGEDPERDGLKDTPDRVIRAWKEMTSGYQQDPKEILVRQFDVKYDEIIILKDIEFYSTCEHHLLPFVGVAHIGYIPKKYVVGISKLARLVECFAKRLQIQERMTVQIAQTFNDIIQPQGIGVIVQAKHLCMRCRGVKKDSAEMITSCMLGAMRNQHDTRDEFLKLCGFGK